MTVSRTLPTLYEWAGGRDAFEQLTKVVYQRITDEPLLAPLLAHMSTDHPRLVAAFIASPTNPHMEQSCHDGQQLRIDRTGICQFPALVRAKSRAWHGFKRAGQRLGI